MQTTLRIGGARTARTCQQLRPDTRLADTALAKLAGTGRTTVALMLALLLLPGAGCPAHRHARDSGWTSTTISYGQGELRLGIRLRSAADQDKSGAVIRTPEGGEAWVRIFACGRSFNSIREYVRKRMRGRLVRAALIDLEDHKGFAWRWLQGKTLQGRIFNSAVIHHGPLLIAVTSENLPLSEVTELATRVRLELPIPLIRGCFPLCNVGETKCVPENQDEIEDADDWDE